MIKGRPASGIKMQQTVGTHTRSQKSPYDLHDSSREPIRDSSRIASDNFVNLITNSSTSKLVDFKRGLAGRKSPQ